MFEVVTDSLNKCLQVNPSLLVTHDIAMKDYKNAFQTLVSGDCCKVLIDPSDP